MTKDILTFALEGEVALQDFAKALDRLSLLLGSLAEEVGGHEKIDWIIDEMYAGSAVASFQGVHPDRGVVENVVNAYEEVGDALATGKEIPFSANIHRHASALTTILSDKITAIRLETSAKDYLISSKAEHDITTAAIEYTYGTVRGSIETLSMRRRLSFTLWDSLFDKPVHCYFKPGEEDNMRHVWGKKAVVAGKIGRQPETGKPIVIRDVKYVRLLNDEEPGSYRRVRGVLAWAVGEEKPEELIRKLRDAQ